MGIVGEIFASLSFAGALVATIAFLFAGLRKGDEVKSWRIMGKAAFGLHGGSVLGIVGTLFYLIYTHQYQFHYVWSHSSNELPVHYMISCFWEGQEGSFLLWTFWHVVLGSLILIWGGKFRDIVLGIIASVNLILASMILGVYVPGLGGKLLYLLALGAPIAWLLYEAFQKGDPFYSNGIVQIGSGLLGLIAFFLVLTEKTAFFSFHHFSRYFESANLPFLLVILAFAAFLIYFGLKIYQRLSDESTEDLNMASLFSVIVVLGLSLIAFTTDFGILKIGSTPFMKLSAAFPDAPIFQSNPNFKPINGNGLNPLLQNYWMVIHPPTLFLGFASTVVPFAYVIGGLMTNRFVEWVRPAIPWLIFSVMILGIGIIMGGYWAYETLNFGGYWNWDPVENSSLVPWLCGIASLHALIAYRKSKAFLKVTMVLVVATFILVLYSTFLTRSGILGETSVHAFTDLGMSGQLLMLLFLYIIWMVALFLSRWKRIPVARRTIETNSPEAVLFLGVLALCNVGIVVIIATSIPVFNALFGTNWAPVVDAPFFYYRWTIWFAIGMALLCGIGQFMYWRKVEKKKLTSALLRPYLVAIGIAAVIILGIALGTNWEFGFEDRYRDWRELADLSGNGLKMGMRYIKVGFFIFTDEILLFSALFMVVANLDVMISLLRKRGKTRIVTGGSIAHVGFGLMLIGFLFSSGYDQVISKNINPNELAALPQDARVDNVLLEKNIPRDIMGYQVTYLGKKEAVGPVAEVEILWETEDEFKISFEDATGDVFAAQLPRLVFLNEDKGIDREFLDSFLNEKLEFLKPKHINDRTLYGVRFVPRTRDAENKPVYHEDKAFTLYPEAEVNPEMGLVAHPSRQIKLSNDVYVHVSTIPKAEEEQPKFEFHNWELGIGDTVTTRSAGVYFEGLESLPVEGTPFSVIAKAKLRVLSGRGEMFLAEPLYRIDQENRISVKEHYLDELATAFAFVAVNPATGKITLQAQEQVNRPEDIIVIQVLKKPWINVLWIGTFVLVAGFIVAMVRRIRENLRLGGKSVAAKEEYDENSAAL